MGDTDASKVVVLDGGPADNMAFDRTRTALLELIGGRAADVQVFALRDLKLAHCIGCWTETPGICRYHEAAGVAIVRAVIASDTVVLLTPVTFGGYSAQTKQIIDRFAALVLPYFQLEHDEVHHRPRYAHNPRWVAVGVQNEPIPEDARIFKLVAGAERHCSALTELRGRSHQHDGYTNESACSASVSTRPLRSVPVGRGDPSNAATARTARRVGGTKASVVGQTWWIT